MGLAWVSAVCTALLFWRVGTAIDELVGHGRPDGGAFTALIVLAVLAATAAGGGAWLSEWASSATERRLRRLVVSRIFELGAVRGTGRSGSLLALATQNVERTAHYRAAFIGPIIGALSTPFIVLAVLALTVDPVVAGWLAVLILLVPLAIGGFQRAVRPIGAAYRRTQARLTAGFLEAIQALDTLVYARAADRTAADLAGRGEAHRRSLMRMLAGNQLLILVVDAAFSLTIVVAAAVLAVTRVAGGQLSLGGGIAILLMTILVIGPVDVVGQFFYVGIGGRAAQRQLSAHLAGDTSTAARPAEPAADGDAGMIEFRDVTAGWPGGEPILEHLSFRVDRGERVALVGPSGIGKSTAAALIQAHLAPRAGRVLVDGLDVARAEPDVIRARLAVVEQRTFLFLGTIADNLRVAAPDATDDALWRALELAGLRAEVEAMSEGLATPVGEHGALLSGGQAQRLAIARASLRDAPILVLDEPTSQVDLAGETAILDALDRLATGRTVLMIAHRPGAILAADRVVDLAAHAEAGA
ncbi:MAG TPA: ABC transporter ATP-binding protein [Pseudonocardiaceae bacterium]